MKRGKTTSPKKKPLSALRKSAKGEACTLEIVGVCNHNPETTVLCHIRDFGTGGTGLKPSDLCAVYGCHECHAIIDGRYDHSRWAIGADYYGLKWEYIARALARTHERMLETGVLKL